MLEHLAEQRESSGYSPHNAELQVDRNPLGQFFSVSTTTRNVRYSICTAGTIFVFFYDFAVSTISMFTFDILELRGSYDVTSRHL